MASGYRRCDRQRGSFPLDGPAATRPRCAPRVSETVLDDNRTSLLIATTALAGADQMANITCYDPGMDRARVPRAMRGSVCAVTLLALVRVAQAQPDPAPAGPPTAPPPGDGQPLEQQPTPPVSTPAQPVA